MKTKLPDLSLNPSDALEVDPKKKCGDIQGPFTIDGSKKEDSSLFEFTPKYGADNYLLSHSPKDKTKIFGVIGITRANSFISDPADPSGGRERAKVQAALYRALYDAPEKTALLISEESLLKSDNNNKDLLVFTKNPNLDDEESSSIILDCSSCTHKGLSPRVTELDNGSKTLRLPALINLRLHVIGSTQEHNISYNLKTRQIQELKKAINENECAVKSGVDLKKLEKLMESFLDKVSVCEP